VVLDGENGYLVPERDAPALARKLKLFISDPNSWEIMGERGRKHIESYHNVARQASMLEKVYDKVLKGNRGEDRND